MKKISNYIHVMGRVAISEALGRYDIRSEKIRVGEKTYRRRNSATREYQTPFGGILIERQMYVNRKNDGDGLSIGFVARKPSKW